MQRMPNTFGNGHGARGLAPKASVKNFKETLAKFFTYLAAKKLQLFLVLLFTIVTTVITIIGIRLNGTVIDTYIAKRDLSGLKAICLIMAGMYLTSSLFSYLQNYLMFAVAQETSAMIRNDIFQQIQRFSLSYFDRHQSGDLMSRMTNDVDNINTALSQTFVQFCTNIVSVVGMFFAMLFLSPLLTLVVLTASGITYLVSSKITKRTQRYFLQQQRDLGQMNGYIEEMLSGKTIVQLFGQQEQVKTDFDQYNQHYTKNAYKAQVFSGLLGPANNTVNNIAYLAITVVGAVALLHGGMGITVGSIFAFLIYMRNFTGPINNMLNLINTLQLTVASAERVFEVIEAPVEADLPHAEEINAIRGDVAFENIDFAYDKKLILHDLTLTAKAGETIAIVGPTGAGKTTIINLLTKLYPIKNGQITIDGLSIDRLQRKSLRKHISVVQQETFLFSKTVRENIRYGRLDARDEEVIAACKKANAHDFIMQLPQGYDSILADNGENLSQGQRQLLSIARAILAEAPILILDEATSSIDTNTEQHVQDAMLQLMAEKTSFVIAHRLSTIKNADKIVVIKDGQVIESGKHDALLAQHGFYSQLYTSQFTTGLGI